VDQHLDLVRTDLANAVQTRVARVFVGDEGDPGSVSLKIDADGQWERLVREALEPHLWDTAEHIVRRLQESFSGPYVVVQGPHSADACPFEHGDVPIKVDAVAPGDYRLPSRQ
jgi:hypothetical protein